MLDAVTDLTAYKAYLRRTIQIENAQTTELSYPHAILRAAIQASLNPVETGQIDSFVDGSLKGSRALYLPHVMKGGKPIPMIPVMAQSGSRSDSNHISFHLFCTFAIHGHLWAYCFRCEEPESPGDAGQESVHGFHHVQLVMHSVHLPRSIQSVFGQVDPLFEMENETVAQTAPADNSIDVASGPFFADSIPAFPLPATCRAELLIALLASLYGWRRFYATWVSGLSGYTEYVLMADRVRQACVGAQQSTG
jgi:hypothetical protein